MPPKKSPAGPATATGAKAPAVDKKNPKGTDVGAGKAELVPHFCMIRSIAHAASQAEAEAIGRGFEPKLKLPIREDRSTIQYGGHNSVYIVLCKDRIDVMGATFRTHAEIAPQLAKSYEKGLTHTRGCLQFSRRMLSEYGVPEDIIKLYAKVATRDAQAALDFDAKKKLGAAVPDTKKKTTKKPSTGTKKASPKATRAKASATAGKKGAQKQAAKK
jgi:hypothetical protein